MKKIYAQWKKGHREQPVWTRKKQQLKISIMHANMNVMMMHIHAY